MRRLALAILAILLVPVLPAACTDVSGAPSGTDETFLVDWGDGTYEWHALVPGGTLCETAAASLAAAGLECETDGSRIVSVGGVGTETTGTQECGWVFYVWGGASWGYGSAGGSAAYPNTPLAVGHYADRTVVPVSTPNHRDVWVSVRNGSSFSGASNSPGPSAPSPSIEWANVYRTGYVDSNVVAADGFVYHTTGGRYGATGAESNPYVYCLDEVDGGVIWKVMYPKGAGYEVSTPSIVGGTLVVSATNGHMYCLDRKDGKCLAELLPEGESPHLASGSAPVSEYALEETKDPLGNWLLNGQTFVTGPTSSAYDAGALYFCTYDGAVRAYSVDPESGFGEIWKYVPDDSMRGCFYYHPPVVTEVDGTRVVLAGNYAGYMFCIDASTGSGMWSARLINAVSESNGNPGAVGSIVPDGKGGAIVVCTDGDMASKIGRTQRVSLRDGAVLWSLDVISNPAVVALNTFFVYVSPSAGGDKTMYDGRGDPVEAVPGYYGISIDTGRIVWSNESSALVKAGMTFSGGRLYSADYSAGTFWPLGGGVTCLDPDTGAVLWRIKIEPSSGNSFCMSQPVVVDGRVFLGTDYGAVYCVSDGRDLLLVDYGENVEWYRLDRGSTLSNSVFLTLTGNGVDVAFDQVDISEISAVGGVAAASDTGHWVFYVWKDGSWSGSSAEEAYTGGNVAIAVYSGAPPSKDPTRDYGVTPEIDYRTPGLMHWSWALLSAATVLVTAAVVRAYRRVGSVV